MKCNDRIYKTNKPLFDIYIWNCYQAVINNSPRTNDAVEGWHRSFNEKIRVHHAQIGKFSSVLKSEQDSTELYIRQKMLDGNVIL